MNNKNVHLKTTLLMMLLTGVSSTYKLKREY